MNNKFKKWLYQELPELVAKEIITDETAYKIREYYGDIKSANKSRIALIIFGIFGALLIGLGIILLLAHNWDNFSRAVRTFLSLAPLVIAQILAGWVILKRNDSSALKEGTSTFLTIMIGSSIALISQTYNLGGDFSTFLLTWMLLTIPIVYLMNVTVPAIIYFIGITSWSGNATYEGDLSIYFWILALLFLPHFIQTIKKDTLKIKSFFLALTFSICLCFASGITLSKILPGLWTVIYCSIFVIFYFIGTREFKTANLNWQAPFLAIGTLGNFIIAFASSYKDSWKYIDTRFIRYTKKFQLVYCFDYIVPIIFLIFALYIAIYFLRQGQKLKFYFCLTPVLSVIGYIFSVNDIILVPAIIFNIYFFLLGICTMVVGFKSMRLGVINAGMIILFMVIAARFFDSGLGFIARGIVFIILGIGFLTTNLILLKKQKKSNE